MGVAGQTKEDRVRDQILSCNRCALRSSATSPVPYRGDPSTARGIVIGEGPGRQEDEQGVPFVGDAGQLLFSELRRLKVREGDVMICNATCCRPPQPKPSAALLADYAAVCGDNLKAQVGLASRTAPILLLGQVALWALRRDVLLREARGRTFVWPHFEQVCVTASHPAYVLRNRGELESWRGELKEWATCLKSGPRIPVICWVCGETADTRYDEWMMAWCADHWGRARDRTGARHLGREEPKLSWEAHRGRLRSRQGR